MFKVDFKEWISVFLEAEITPVDQALRQIIKNHGPNGVSLIDAQNELKKSGMIATPEDYRNAFIFIHGLKNVNLKDFNKLWKQSGNVELTQSMFNSIKSAEGKKKEQRTKMTPAILATQTRKKEENDKLKEIYDLYIKGKTNNIPQLIEDAYKMYTHDLNADQRVALSKRVEGIILRRLGSPPYNLSLENATERQDKTQKIDGFWSGKPIQIKWRGPTSGGVSPRLLYELYRPYHEGFALSDHSAGDYGRDVKGSTEYYFFLPPNEKEIWIIPTKKIKEAINNALIASRPGGSWFENPDLFSRSNKVLDPETGISLEKIEDSNAYVGQANQGVTLKINAYIPINLLEQDAMRVPKGMAPRQIDKTQIIPLVDADGQIKPIDKMHVMMNDKYFNTASL